MCPICKQGPEDIKHLLFTCERTAHLWKALGVTHLISDVVHTDRSGSVILEQIFHQMNQPLQCMPSVHVHEIIAIGAWYLWWLRRQSTHNEPIPPMSRWPLSVLGIAGHANAASAHSMTPNAQVKWSKPNPGFVKLNVDASFHADEGAGATAAVIRDFSGKFLAGRCYFYPHAANVVSMEAMAMKEGLILANNLGFQRVMAESDSMEVVNFCTGQTQWWDPAAAIYAECVDVVTMIGKVDFLHCPREANGAAHEIAKYSFLNKFSCTWDDDPPSWLYSKLVDDVMLLNNQ